jgi:hypothetical protein
MISENDFAVCCALWNKLTILQAVNSMNLAEAIKYASSQGAPLVIFPEVIPPKILY